jgi:hypothetical protein
MCKNHLVFDYTIKSMTLLVTQVSPIPIKISYIQIFCLEFCFQKSVHYSKSIRFYVGPAIRSLNTKSHSLSHRFAYSQMHRKETDKWFHHRCSLLFAYDRHCVYNMTLRHIHVTTAAVEKQ